MASAMHCSLSIGTPPYTNIVDRFRDWSFPDSSSNWWTGKTKDFYSLVRLQIQPMDKCNQRWGMAKNNTWWLDRLKSVWTDLFDLRSKVFICRIVMGCLPVGSLLRNRGINAGSCIRCTGKTESLKHCFWYCPTIKEWWSQLCSILSPVQHGLNKFCLTFGTFTTAIPEHAWILVHIRYWMLWFIWSVRNDCVFSNQNAFSAGLPWHLIRKKLLEDSMVVNDQQFCIQVQQIIMSL